MNKIFLVIFFISLYCHALIAQVGINPANNPPDASAGLDVSFSDKGFLPPRVALTAINAAAPVSAPAAGLLVYNTTTAGVSPNNVVPGYYYWSGTKWISVSPSPGINTGDMRYWDGAKWIIIPAGTNGQVLTYNYGVPMWGGTPVPCGPSITVSHVAGAVAPVSKTVTYATVSNIPGETSKCWITSNLGADRQATALADATELSAGWYWQFNRKQGYKHDGTTRTPNTTWITSIDEDSDWQLANDPCAIELGAGWRIPTTTEWTNIDAAGNWTNWNGPWGSVLKLHNAGNLNSNDGSLMNRGLYGYYWSSTQSSTTNGWFLGFSPNNCMMYNNVKAYPLSVRCVRDY
jgi:uncharacterized protein (TIGR02145 family)